MEGEHDDIKSNLVYGLSNSGEEGERKEIEVC